MKKFELFFVFIKLPLDYLLIVLAGFTAYALRFTDFITSIKPVLFNLPWDNYWPAVFATAGVWVVIFALAGLYQPNPNKKLVPELNSIFFACAVGFATITVYVFFTLQKFDSRFLVLAGWIFAFIYVALGRILIRIIKMGFYKLDIGRRRVIIIGRENIATIIQEFLNNKKGLGYKVVGNYKNFTPDIRKKHPDEIIFTNPKSNEIEVLQAIDFANEHHITFKYSADLFATISANMAMSTMAGVPIIEIKRTPLDGWGKISKRIFDIIVSVIILIITSPICLLVSIFILIETGRPIIYKNKRVGIKGKEFYTLKFRSMRQEHSTGEKFGGAAALKKEQELIKQFSIKEGPIYKIKDDPRITKVGKFIRKWSLDELPQFWNVIRGEMSVIGPRPHQPREVAQYEKHHKAVLTIKPGITGLAQISGRSNLSFEEEVKLDIFYIEHWTLLLDLFILFKTPFVVVRKKGAL
jgi:exopolysaccharide biosynthesis polyprenyl glycosylphosphotransferase